jgi:large subunit ribosomal protein L19
MIDLNKNFNTTTNPNIPDLKAGDQVSVHVRSRKGGNNANFTVRRTASNGIGVERTFLFLSPRIDKVVVDRHTHVRRAQLYFLRGLTGKKAHLKQKFE